MQGGLKREEMMKDHLQLFPFWYTISMFRNAELPAFFNEVALN